MRTVRGWRILGLACALLGTLLGAMPLPVAAGLDHVLTCNGSGTGSLPDVVAHAIANDTVVFDVNCWSTNAISLSSTITIAVDLTIDATSPLHDAMVDGGGAVTVFRVNPNVTATLKGVTIQRGFGGASGGGGIYNSGTLTVADSVFSANTAVGASGIGGGAIRNDGTLTVASSSFGGVAFPGNSVSSGPGGGIANYGTLTVTGSSFGAGMPGSGNSAGNGHSGGAIYDHGPKLIVANSTFTHNAAGAGGGIEIDSVAGATVTNSTFSGNTATGSGGGIEVSSSTAAVTNTIIAGNSAGTSPEINGPMTSGGHNLVGRTTGSSGWIASDLTGILNPVLNAATGAPLTTLPPMSGSPAIGAGDASVCSQAGAGMVNGVDELGQPRLPSTCDIGAFQTQGTGLAAGLSAGGGSAGTAATLTVTLFDGYGNPLTPYTGTVHFASSDPLATLPADYSFTGKGSGKDNGTHGFTVTFRTAGTQRVTATDTLSGTLTAQVTAALTPVVSSVMLPSGSTAGGNHVTLTGIGFGATPANVAVILGDKSALVASVTNTQLVVTAPSHAAGAVDVVVTVSGQSVTIFNGYTYGFVNAMPDGKPTVGTPGNPSPLPSTRPPGVSPGNPSPLPAPRP